jgi:probable HAF family extracellular repeat protein
MRKYNGGDMKLRLLFGSSLLGSLALLAIPAQLGAQERLHDEHAPLRYTVTDLGVVGPTPGQAYAINRGGLIGGAAVAPDGAMHAVLWYNRRKLDIGIGGANSVALDLNDWGQTVGEAETSTPDPNGEDFCGFKTLGFPSSGNCLPFFWQQGRMHPLPTLGGNNGWANSVNNYGDAAGTAENATPDPACQAPQVLQFKPVFWKDGRIHELPTIDGDPEGVAEAINDNGDVVGASGDCGTFGVNLTYLVTRHALLWKKGRAIDLGNLGGEFGNIAFWLNDRGEVVGSSDLAGDATGHAFRWTKETGMQDLGTLPGDIISTAAGINEKGEIVGLSLDPNFNLRAFLWRNGQMIDLNSLVPTGSPLLLMLGVTINSEGEIVGLAMEKSTGEFHGFLAIPR